MAEAAYTDIRADRKSSAASQLNLLYHNLGGRAIGERPLPRICAGRLSHA